VKSGCRGEGGGQRVGRASGAAGASTSRGNLMQYDSDGDKRISREEAPGRIKSFFDRVDANGDSFITNTEIKKLREQMQQSGRQPSGGPQQ